MSKDFDPSLDEFILAAIAAIDRVRNFHNEINAGPANAAGICGHCKEDYPCPTINALNGEQDE